MKNERRNGGGTEERKMLLCSISIIMLKLTVGALLLLLLPSLSCSTQQHTAPGERILELLAQVKTNTENHEEVSDTHESLRAGICQSKTTSLAEHVNLLRSRLSQAGGNTTGVSETYLNKCVSALTVTSVAFGK